MQNIKSDQLWEQEKDADGTHTSWYSKAVEYWDQQEATYNGVLGGFGEVSDVDIRDSRSLLLKVRARAAQLHWLAVLLPCRVIIIAVCCC